MSDNPIADAIKVLSEALAKDDDYAIGWKSNIAMACADAASDILVFHVGRDIGNDAADRFIKNVFGVDTSHLCK